MALHLCRETFTGELAPGLAKTFHAGVDVLDDSKKDEAALLKKFGLYFSEVASTHIYTDADIAAAKTEQRTKSAAKGQRTRERNAPPQATPAQEKAIAATVKAEAAEAAEVTARDYSPPTFTSAPEPTAIKTFTSNSPTVTSTTTTEKS
jgi:hypothetical protein